ncbi:MASE1 domain-containing protein [Rhodanobacter sp. DHG33]|uniref:MASE1 domain-containing protein n=1 Tax=Rhodanobacter sp. DHG33 TaxID=2775921 RepID=UPI001781A5FE|nr:MASE1 domain-containing protein [Rhodanobacter sp. DHG33]MBD8900583.1 MASE1 domain-containing protein [Rhodanobacter sp. DHG33]
MQIGSKVGALLCQAAVAVIYLIALLLFRQILIPHWIVLTGFHLAVLMLAPYRYWPALFVGETLHLAYVSLSCLDQFGLTWAVVNTIPSITYEAPVVWWFRERRQLFPAKGAVNMAAFVSCALTIAAIATIETILQLQLTPLPPGYIIHYSQVIARLMLGNFMGVLTVAPFALVLHQGFAEAQRAGGHWLHDTLDTPLFLESMFVVLPILCFLGWIGHSDHHARGAAQIAMFLPVVILALRHGWRGAATAGTMASIGIVLLMPATNDHATLQAETLVALAISTMLLVGARLTHLNHCAQQERWDSHMAMALAQRNIAMGEAQLRETAQSLDQLRDSINGVFNLMLRRLRHLQPVANDDGYRRQAQKAQEQFYLLADSLSPSMLCDRGLPDALVQGAVPRALVSAGMKYWCDIRGPVCLVPQPMAMAVYRVVCEAVAEACLTREPSDVLVKIRCGISHRAWLVVMVETRRDPIRSLHVAWDLLLQQLQSSTTGLGRKAIEDRAATFGGKVRERPIHDGRRVIVSFQGENHPNA